ncbi:MAG: RNAase P [archaeon]
MKKNIKTKWIKELALKRIEKLFKLAKENIKDRPDRSRRYIQLAWEISKKYNTRIPFKNTFCKKCFTLIIPGKTSIVRLDSRKKKIVYICLNCGHKKTKVYERLKE